MISQIKRDMKELEDQAAASARAALQEKEHSLQLERDLMKVCTELESVKKDAAHNKKLAETAVSNFTTGLERCRKGIQIMSNCIFGKFLFTAFLLYLTLHSPTCYSDLQLTPSCRLKACQVQAPSKLADERAPGSLPRI